MWLTITPKSETRWSRDRFYPCKRVSALQFHCFPDGERLDYAIVLEIGDITESLMSLYRNGDEAAVAFVDGLIDDKAALTAMRTRIVRALRP